MQWKDTSFDNATFNVYLKGSQKKQPSLQRRMTTHKNSDFLFKQLSTSKTTHKKGTQPCESSHTVQSVLAKAVYSSSSDLPNTS